MKRFSHFLSEARDAEDAIYGRRGAEKRRREQKERVMKKERDRLNKVTAHDAPPSSPAPQTDDSNLIHIGGNYMGSSGLLRVPGPVGGRDEPPVPSP